MAYRPLNHNDRVKINQALDARNACHGTEDILMQSYEWHGKKEDRPAFDVFLESEREFQEYLNNKDPNEKPYREMTPQEAMEKLNAVLGDGENVWVSWYESYYGDIAPLSSIARKMRIRFFNSRAHRLELLQHDIDAGVVINVDDSEEIKLFFEKAAFKWNLMSEEKAAVIRALPTPLFS